MTIPAILPASVAGDDCGFDVTAPVQHVTQYLLQARERSFSGNVIRGTNLLSGDQAEGAAHGFRRVMEVSLQGHFRIVQALRIELDFSAAGTTTEEIHGAAFAHHIDRPLPSLGAPHRFDHNIATAFLRAQRANGVDDIFDFIDLHDLVRTHVLGGFDLAIAFDDRNHVAANGAPDLNEHEADGSAADDRNRVADFHLGLVESAQHAGQRLGHCGIFVTHVGRNDQHVGFDNALGNANVFGVGPVVKQQIFAKIFLMLGAIETHLAGRGIEGDHAHAFFETVDAGADFFDDPGQLVAEQCRRDDHARMIAALKNFEVGSAGQRDLNFDQNLAGAYTGNGDSFNFEIFFAVEDGSRHFSVQS